MGYQHLGQGKYCCPLTHGVCVCMRAHALQVGGQCQNLRGLLEQAVLRKDARAKALGPFHPCQHPQMVPLSDGPLSYGLLGYG